jgi:predicted nucleic acid-binding protein
VADPSVLLEETGALGVGEASAITLAWQNRGNAKLILDEKRGRTVAKALGLKVTGLLGILTDASVLGLVDFDVAMEKLLATGFRLSPALAAEARARYECERQK